MIGSALTSATNSGTGLTDIRCVCGRLQFRMDGASEGLYIQCRCHRCKRTVEVMGEKTVLVSSSSPVRVYAL